MPGIDQYTKLLLHMDGDQSSEIGGNDPGTRFLCHFDTAPFVDASHEMFTITNSNVTRNASVKKFGGGSAYFDGTTSNGYLDIPDSDSWTWSSGTAFTIDFWCRADSSQDTGSPRIIDSSSTSNSEARFQIYLDEGEMRMMRSGTIILQATYTAETWQHWAFVRETDNSITLYRNGTAVDSDTDTTSYDAAAVRIGNWRRGTDRPFKGYLDELRISKHIARWTENFIPPTTYYGGHRLIPVSGPKLDSSVKKFGSASMYFDGTDDYVKINNHNDWDLLSEDFTIDCWVKHTDHSSTESYIGLKEDGSNNWHFGHVDGTGLQFKFKSAGSDIVSINASSGEIADTDWHHVAVVKNGNDYKLFMDGVMVGSVTDSSTDTLSGDLTIGAKGGDSGQLFNGYIDELRISKGIARWTSNFTPPTEEYTTDEYTKLLLHFSGDMSDSNHSITFHDFARIDVSPTKWNGSFYFDGAGDYLTLPDSDDWNLGGQDFAIDLWYYPISLDGYHWIMAHDEDNDNRWQLFKNPSNQIAFTIKINASITTSLYSTSTVDENSWQHIAVTCSGTDAKLYINGSEENSDTYSSSTDFSGTLYIGRYPRNENDYLDGYLDEVRLSQGDARWTSEFDDDLPSEPYSPNYISGDMSDSGRIIALRETDWSVVYNQTHSGGSYIASNLGSDPVTVIFRKSDGESQGYGNITPQ